MTGDDSNVLAETVSVRLRDGECAQGTVAYRDDTDVSRIALILPPNPMLGGDSENNVVRALLEEAVAVGWLAVTCDYRGVANGRVGQVDLMSYWEALEASGDFSLIVDDIVRVVAAVRDDFGSGPCQAIVGYSFGSYLALWCAEALSVSTVAGISPPIMEYDFSARLSPRISPLFFAAPDDVFCPVGHDAGLFADHDVAVQTVASDDHFFRGTETELAHEVFAAIGKYVPEVSASPVS